MQARSAQEAIHMAYPADYRYTKEHEWLKVEGNTGTVGITDHAQESLGDIVFVELPKVGSEITAGKSLWHGRIGEGGFGDLCAGFRDRNRSE